MDQGDSALDEGLGFLGGALVSEEKLAEPEAPEEGEGEVSLGAIRVELEGGGDATADEAGAIAHSLAQILVVVGLDQQPEEHAGAGPVEHQALDEGEDGSCRVVARGGLGEHFQKAGRNRHQHVGFSGEVVGEMPLGHPGRPGHLGLR